MLSMVQLSFCLTNHWMPLALLLTTGLDCSSACPVEAATLLRVLLVIFIAKSTPKQT